MLEKKSWICKTCWFLHETQEQWAFQSVVDKFHRLCYTRRLCNQLDKLSTKSTAWPPNHKVYSVFGTQPRKWLECNNRTCKCDISFKSGMGPHELVVAQEQPWLGKLLDCRLSGIALESGGPTALQQNAQWHQSKNHDNTLCFHNPHNKSRPKK